MQSVLLSCPAILRPFSLLLTNGFLDIVMALSKSVGGGVEN